MILAVDQGTTSTRAMVFNTAGRSIAQAQVELAQSYPEGGWVEHDPEAIWQATLAVGRQAVKRAGGAVQAIGITNQRETTIVWERATGKPIYPAIVWQDRRTAPACAALAEHAEVITQKTGLLLDPYFSGTKVAWILDHVPDARRRAEAGELAFGTVDSYLVWKLTGGRVHATDATNASRTLLFDIHRQCWDDEMLGLLEVPGAMLPQVRDSADDYGVALPQWFGRGVPIAGVAGDQQAAAVGQACFEPGMVKSTYGTGCFAMMNTGAQAALSRHKLLTTVAYRLDGAVTYALEGSIFVAGAAVQWLRDGLGIIDSAGDTEALARSLPDNAGVYLVPAFTGLGAPYWDPHARGALSGLTRDTNVAHLARAALESVCYQTHDLVKAMVADRRAALTSIRVDGGMVANDWLVQCLADIVGVAVERPAITETTALGAAYLAGLQIGCFSGLDELSAKWERALSVTPEWPAARREAALAGWAKAVARVSPG
ncbi:MAG: glycerol kinase GlpK [Gammaproteobacteria bacterium]|nr:glycerol kinase GlpK [Gammaproteobacteria bacterium]